MSYELKKLIKELENFTTLNEKKIVDMFKEELKEAIPEICAMVGTTDFKDIVPIVEQVLDEQNETYVSKISENSS